MAYLIQGSTLTAIAAQVRRISGESNPMTPAQMASVLSAVPAADGDDVQVFKFRYASPENDMFQFIASDLLEYLKVIRMPTKTTVGAYDFADFSYLKSAYFPACTSVGTRAFRSCEALEELTLNSSCAIAGEAFLYVISPDSKTFRLYLRGSTMGTCDYSAFTSAYYTGDSSDPVDIDVINNNPMPGLEIYVPASLLNDFKTTWADGYLANNIFPLPN